MMESDYDWYTDSGAEAEEKEELNRDAYILLGMFPDLMHMNTPLRFSTMSREVAEAHLAKVVNTDAFLHEDYGDAWLSAPLHRAMKLEADFFRANLHRFGK